MGTDPIFPHSSRRLSSDQDVVVQWCVVVEPPTTAAALRLLNAAAAASGSVEAGIAPASSADAGTSPILPAANTTVPAALVALTAPSRTEIYAGFTSATMKSVPRMPIIAWGVRSATAARLRVAIAPETIRSAPLSRAKTERSEEHTSELQSRLHLVCRLLLEKKKEICNT